MPLIFCSVPSTLAVIFSLPSLLNAYTAPTGGRSSLVLVTSHLPTSSLTLSGWSFLSLARALTGHTQASIPTARRRMTPIPSSIARYYAGPKDHHSYRPAAYL